MHSGEDALHGLMQRLGFIEQVGLGYLTLDVPIEVLAEERLKEHAWQPNWEWAW